MNKYTVIFGFQIDAEREYGTSHLSIDVVAKTEEAAVNKAERTIPRMMMFQYFLKHRVV